MYCRKCGELNEESAVTCKRCGEPMQPIPAAAPAQPGAPIGGPPPVVIAKIPNHLVQAILVTALCCLPCGIVAIVYASQVNTKIAQGDLDGARTSSRKANLWSWIGAGVGIVGVIFYVALMLLGFVATNQ